jgi:hypothetical protein
MSYIISVAADLYQLATCYTDASSRCWNHCRFVDEELRRPRGEASGGDMRCAWYQQGRETTMYINTALGLAAASLSSSACWEQTHKHSQHVTVNSPITTIKTKQLLSIPLKTDSVRSRFRRTVKSFVETYSKLKTNHEEYTLAATQIRLQATCIIQSPRRVSE